MMARRRKPARPSRCCRCRLERLPEETWRGGFCPSCAAARARARRKATGAKVIARAEPMGSVQHEGKTYRVTLLPPKRRRR